MTGRIKGFLRERWDRLNQFYVLEDHAKGKRADHPFMIFEGRSWTYKQTYEAVLKYGTWLKKTYNIKPKEVVAMDFMNSDKFILVWFSLWSIGAKPAFINYNLTSKALVHCIKVSTTRLVLVDPQIQENVTQEVRQELSNVIFVDFVPEMEAAIMATDPVREPDSCRTEDRAANLSILIYTSGTTGLPKAAIVSWDKITVGPLLFARWMGLRKDDIFYTVSSPAITDDF